MCDTSHLKEVWSEDMLYYYAAMVLDGFIQQKVPLGLYRDADRHGPPGLAVDCNFHPFIFEDDWHLAFFHNATQKIILVDCSPEEEVSINFNPTALRSKGDIDFLKATGMLSAIKDPNFKWSLRNTCKLYNVFTEISHINAINVLGIIYGICCTKNISNHFVGIPVEFNRFDMHFFYTHQLNCYKRHFIDEQMLGESFYRALQNVLGEKDVQVDVTRPRRYKRPGSKNLVPPVSGIKKVRMEKNYNSNKIADLTDSGPNKDFQEQSQARDIDQTAQSRYVVRESPDKNSSSTTKPPLLENENSGEAITKSYLAKLRKTPKKQAGLPLSPLRNSKIARFSESEEAQAIEPDHTQRMKLRQSTIEISTPILSTKATKAGEISISSELVDVSLHKVKAKHPIILNQIKESPGFMAAASDKIFYSKEMADRISSAMVPNMDRLGDIDALDTIIDFLQTIYSTHYAKERYSECRLMCKDIVRGSIISTRGKKILDYDEEYFLEDLKEDNIHQIFPVFIHERDAFLLEFTHNPKAEFGDTSINILEITKRPNAKDVLSNSALKKLAEVYAFEKKRKIVSVETNKLFLRDLNLFNTLCVMFYVIAYSVKHEYFPLDFTIKLDDLATFTKNLLGVANYIKTGDVQGRNAAYKRLLLCF